MAILTTYPRIIDPFKQGAHSGLAFAYGIGISRNDNVITKVEAGTLALADNATNYVEMTTSGTASCNTVGYTKGRIPLYTVVASGGVITSVSDDRCFFNVGGGGGANWSYLVMSLKESSLGTSFGMSPPAWSEYSIDGFGMSEILSETAIAEPA